jgi:catechol 2,3-dioxygenase-like lactoylglutathione lyase family enzyme
VVDLLGLLISEWLTAGPATRAGGSSKLAPMEVLSSRILLRPSDLERSLHFYEDVLGLAVYREWGEGKSRGVVFFLGGGLLEVSGSSAQAPSDAVRFFLQVRYLRSARELLVAAGVAIEEEPEVKPWGLFEMVARDPDQLALVFVEVPPGHPLQTAKLTSAPIPAAIEGATGALSRARELKASHCMELWTTS